MNDAEIVVVGAGIAGASAAYALARAGRDVALVEQFTVGHARGSSHGDSRVFRLSYPTADWVALARLALSGWHVLEAASGVALLTTTGSLDLGGASENAAALDGAGIATEILDRKTARRRYGVRLELGEVALFQPDAGVIMAEQALRTLIDAAAAHGARLHEDTPVLSVTQDAGGVEVATPRGTLRCGCVVVTAGPWARSLLGTTGIELAVETTRETVAYVAAARAAELPVLIEQDTGSPGAIYALPHAPRILKIGAHAFGPTTDPDTVGTADDRVGDIAVGWLAKRLPGSPGELERLDTCIYTTTADERFVLERHGRVVVGSACSGHGFKFAPVVGDTLARLATDVLAQPERAH